jgi:hypothetical protein
MADLFTRMVAFVALGVRKSWSINIGCEKDENKRLSFRLSFPERSMKRLGPVYH